MKSAAEYTLFDTKAGACGIAWNARGVVKLQLPRSSRIETEKRLRAFPARRVAKAPPEIRKTIIKIQRYFEGKKVDFSSVPVTMNGVTPFHGQIYKAVRKLEWGRTASYGDIARMAGSPGAARAVGQAMARNEISLIVPCHRVLASGRKIGGFTAFGGLATKQSMLKLEGVHLPSTQGPIPSLAEMNIAKAIRYLSKADPELGRLIRAIGPFGLIKREGAPFHRLAHSIIYQQLATKAAAAIAAKVSAALEDRWHPEVVLRTDEDLLLMAGLSRSKLASIRDLAEKAREGVIPHIRSIKTMSDEEIIRRFTVVRGIGTWTAQMFLIFSLLRPDVMPAGDYGVQKGFQIAFKMRKLPRPEAILKRAERWRPYRTIASWYLWRATDSLRKAKKA